MDVHSLYLSTLTMYTAQHANTLYSNKRLSSHLSSSAHLTDTDKSTLYEKLGHETAGVYLPIHKFKCLCYKIKLEQAQHQRCVVRCKNQIIILWVTLQWKPLNMNILIFKHFLWSSRCFLWESLGDTPRRSSTGTDSALGGETGAAGAAGAPRVGATGATAGATNESIWERERHLWK